MSQTIKLVPYPEIKSLDSDDVVFVQLHQDIARFHIAFANKSDLPALLFARYTVLPGQDLYSIAAKTNLTVEALATLNGLAHPDALAVGAELILPNMPGIFVAKLPENDLERIIF